MRVIAYFTALVFVLCLPVLAVAVVWAIAEQDWPPYARLGAVTLFTAFLCVAIGPVALNQAKKRGEIR